MLAGLSKLLFNGVCTYVRVNGCSIWTTTTCRRREKWSLSSSWTLLSTCLALHAWFGNSAATHCLSVSAAPVNSRSPGNNPSNTGNLQVDRYGCYSAAQNSVASVAMMRTRYGARWPAIKVLVSALKRVTEKLQSVLNAAARLITVTQKYERGLSRLMHDDPYWLTVPQRLQYKLAVTIYRCLHHRAPRYLTDYCVPVSEVPGRSPESTICQTSSTVCSTCSLFTATPMEAVIFLYSWTNSLAVNSNLVRHCQMICAMAGLNKKAQLSLTNPREAKSLSKIAPIRRAYNVVADNTGLSSLL